MSTDQVWAVMVHCGAGWHAPHNRSLYRQAMVQACESASAYFNSESGAETQEEPAKSVIQGTAQVLQILEDDPITNAGRGSLLNEQGIIQMDCSLMNGPTGEYGAVGAISLVRYPSQVALHVLHHSQEEQPLQRIPPILLVGEGADQYAQLHSCGAPFTQREEAHAYLSTTTTRSTFEHHTKRVNSGQSQHHSSQPPKKRQRREVGADSTSPAIEDSLGTVGCICMYNGQFAAGTSSGGISLKKSHRVGQAASYGAGCWADDECGVSTSGSGEDITKYLLAYEAARCLKSSEEISSQMHSMMSHLQNHSHPLSRNPQHKLYNQRQVGLMGMRAEFDNQALVGVETIWSHATPTMAIGIFTSTMKQPKIIFSELSTGSDHSTEGSYHAF